MDQDRKNIGGSDRKVSDSSTAEFFILFKEIGCKKSQILQFLTCYLVVISVVIFTVALQAPVKSLCSFTWFVFISHPVHIGMEKHAQTHDDHFQSYPAVHWEKPMLSHNHLSETDRLARNNASSCSFSAATKNCCAASCIHFFYLFITS